jgi:hypothetical protein
MIPLVAIVQVHPSHGRRIRLWLPLFLVWLLLVVLGLVLSPLILIACLIARLNPFAAIWGLIGVFVAMAGTDIEVEAPEATIIVRVI